MRITVAGTGYVGLSNAVLLAQNNIVTAVDVIKEKVDLINSKKSPIVDKEIEDYLSTKELSLMATLDVKRHIRMQILLLFLRQQIMIRLRIILIHLLWRM